MTKLLMALTVTISGAAGYVICLMVTAFRRARAYYDGYARGFNDGCKYEEWDG